MSKKYKFIFSAIAVAFLIIVAGVCFVFFGNRAISGAPNSIQVQKIENDYYLVAQSNLKYRYKFKFEQFIDNEYIVIEYVNNDSNKLKLSEQKLNLVAGNKYRFSACFMNQNDACGNFSDSIEWVAEKNLDVVDEGSVKVEGTRLVWNEVLFADAYDLTFVNGKGQTFKRSSDENGFSLNSLSSGEYIVYIVATSENEFINNSPTGTGVLIVF